MHLLPSSPREAEEVLLVCTSNLPLTQSFGSSQSELKVQRVKETGHGGKGTIIMALNMPSQIPIIPHIKVLPQSFDFDITLGSPQSSLPHQADITNFLARHTIKRDAKAKLQLTDSHQRFQVAMTSFFTSIICIILGLHWNAGR